MTILKKTNALYIIAGALATLALVSSVVVGVLTAVAVFNASLPLIAGLVGLAIFSAATIALSAVAISKNNTVSQQEKFESRVAQRREGEAKARDPVPDIIALPYEDTKVSSPEDQPTEEENGQSCTEWVLGKAKATAKLLAGGAIFAAAAAPSFVGTLFTESRTSPVGDGRLFGNINDTYFRY